MNTRTILLVAAAATAAGSSGVSAAGDQLLPQFEQAAAQPDDAVYELSLNDAVAIVQQRSFRFARSRRSLDQAGLRYQNARAQLLPRVSTYLNADQSARGFTYDSDQFTDFTQTTRGEFRGSASADLSMPIDVSGTIGRQVRQADLSRELSAKDMANTTLDVTLDVQSSYLNALRAQNQLDADDGVVRRLESLLVRAGAAAARPFLEVELANAKQAAQNSRESADNAQDGLKQLLRAPPEIRLRLTTNFREQKQALEREGLLDRALNGRPDIQAALLRVKQADLSAQQVSDYRKPQVRIGAFASQQVSGRNFYAGDYDKFRGHGGGLNVTVPFLQWDNGQLRRNKDVARIQREQATSDAQELRERVAYDVRQQLLAVTRAENRIRNLPDRRQALEALQRAEQALLTAPAENQQALLAQVTNSRQVWRSAETATADAYIDYNNAVFRLKRLIGETPDAVPPAGSARHIPMAHAEGK